MRLAVLTAHSREYAGVAALCIPSHKAFAFRAGATFIEQPFDPDTGAKFELIQRHLAGEPALLWLDADCFVPDEWTLPDIVNGQCFLFPARRCPQLEYLSFAAYFRNCASTWDLLWTLNQHGVALTAALSNPLLGPLAGLMPRGLIHFGGLFPWEKTLKLRAAVSTEAALMRSGAESAVMTDRPATLDHPAKEGTQPESITHD